MCVLHQEWLTHSQKSAWLYLAPLYSRPRASTAWRNQASTALHTQGTNHQHRVTCSAFARDTRYWLLRIVTTSLKKIGLGALRRATQEGIGTRKLSDLEKYIREMKASELIRQHADGVVDRGWGNPEQAAEEKRLREIADKIEKCGCCD